MYKYIVTLKIVNGTKFTAMLKLLPFILIPDIRIDEAENKEPLNTINSKSLTGLFTVNF